MRKPLYQYIPLDGVVHAFSKQNAATLTTGDSFYDIYKCDRCGLEGKLYGLRQDITVEYYNKLQLKKVDWCNRTDAEIASIKAMQMIAEAEPTDVSCPKCESKVKKLNDWIEEKTNIIFSEMICPDCGYHDLYITEQKTWEEFKFGQKTNSKS